MATLHSSADYLRKIHILVADNDHKHVELMVDVLNYLGFRDVSGVQDGFQAVQAMRERETDLLITDWELQPQRANYDLNLPDNSIIRSDIWLPTPPNDGLNLAKYMRASRYSPNPYIPIIMLAGIGLQNYVESARDAGVNEILLKPLFMEILCDRIIAIIDAPRHFVTAERYKGPCRRRGDRPYFGKERRKQDIIVLRHSG